MLTPGWQAVPEVRVGAAASKHETTNSGSGCAAAGCRLPRGVSRHTRLPSSPRHASTGVLPAGIEFRLLILPHAFTYPIGVSDPFSSPGSQLSL